MNVLLRPIDSIEMMLPIEIIVYVCSLDIVQRRFFFLFILTYISIIIIIIITIIMMISFHTFYVR